MRLSKGLQAVFEQAERGSNGSSGPLGTTLEQTTKERLYALSKSFPTRQGIVIVKHEANRTIAEGKWIDK